VGDFPGGYRWPRQGGVR